jgi:hypothetical protein
MLPRTLLAVLVLAAPAAAQAPTPQDPFPEPIPAEEGVIRVNYVEFATIPDFNGAAPRVMHLVTEPGTRRMFAVNMQGPLYSISYDGRSVALYIDVNDPRWGVRVQSQGSERGIQSFAFHPQFAQQGTPGYGKFYIWTDSENTEPTPDFTPLGGGDTHDTVLFEFTARNAAAAAYDGGPPRELMRFQQPYNNHNGGQLAFNPLATPGSADFGLLYIGSADGGSGGDPNNHSQNLANGFGKIFRIDPLGTNSANGRYGIPASNPFAGDNNPQTLGEIYAYGVRNPQRFAWDSRNGTMYFTDIGQNTVEKLSVVTAGANLGWNTWEGSYRFPAPAQAAGGAAGAGRGGAAAGGGGAVAAGGGGGAGRAGAAAGGGGAAAAGGAAGGGRAAAGGGAARGGGGGGRGGGGVSLEGPRSDPRVTYPVAEYAQLDPLLQNQSAASGLVVYRSSEIPQLSNRIVWGDNPSGELFYVSADQVPNGGQSAIRRILLNDGGTAKTLLQLVQQKNTQQGRTPATRVDMRMGHGPEGQVMLLNKRDGVVRMLVR